MESTQDIYRGGRTGRSGSFAFSGLETCYVECCPPVAGLFVSFREVLMSDARAELEIDAAYRRYFPIIRERCRRVLSDPEDAQDVAQETFIRLWRSGFAPSDVPQVLAWIYRTSTRLAVDRLRRRRMVARHQAPATPEPPSPAPDARVAAQQLLRDVASRMPRGELELLVLHRLDGMKQEDIARVLGISDRGVRRLLVKSSARLARLKEELGP